MHDIVETTEFLTRMTDFAEMNAVYRETFGEPFQRFPLLV